MTTALTGYGATPPPASSVTHGNAVSVLTPYPDNDGYTTPAQAGGDGYGGKPTPTHTTKPAPSTVTSTAPATQPTLPVTSGVDVSGTTLFGVLLVAGGAALFRYGARRPTGGRYVAAHRA